jgi:hypothetical protein
MKNETTHAQSNSETTAELETQTPMKMPYLTPVLEAHGTLMVVAGSPLILPGGP